MKNNVSIDLIANTNKSSLIEQWTKQDNSKKSSSVYITSTSIYVFRKRLLKLLPTLRDRFSKNNTTGRSYLEDSILILRRDFGEKFREVFSYDNSSKEELQLKQRGIRTLKNLYLEAEDCIKSAIESENQQISIDEIKDIIINLGEIGLGLDKWSKSVH